MKPSVLLSLLLPAAAHAHPSGNWELTLESGYLRNIGDNTAIDYEIIPTQLTLRSPAVWTPWENAAGAKFVVRHRVSALFESIVAGPEDRYIGLAAAPSLEYWFPSETTSLFFSIGGGLGLTNSAGGADGLGHDLTLNWFAHLGLRRTLRYGLSLLGGVYFLHHSNGGRTDPNPGIDALGATIGLGWSF